MNRIITAIDQEIVELDAKAAKLRMLRQAAMAIEEGEGDALIEGVPAHEIEALAEPVPSTEYEEPATEPAPQRHPTAGRKLRTEADNAEIDDRVYDAIAAISGGAWIAAGAAMAHDLGLSTDVFRRSKIRLREEGRIESRGKSRGMTWRPIDSDEPDAPAPPPSTRPPSSSSSNGRHDRRKAANMEKAVGEDERLRELVEQAGVDGLDAGELAVALDVSQASARGRLMRGAETGRLVSFDGEGGGKRYRSREFGLLPAGEDGCKTGVERKLLEAVKGAPVPLTTVEVAANAKVSMVDAGRVLHGLAKRGVVRAIPLKTETSPQRWELPVEMAEAA